MPNIKEETIRFGLAALAAVSALLIRQLLNPFLGSNNPYHTLWLAVVFSAWYCGKWPSILTVGIGTVGVWYWFLPPYRSFTGKGSSEVFGTLGFLILSAVIVALGEANRQVIRKLRVAEEGLKQAHENLEERARQRTAALQQKTAEVVEKAALLDMANDAIFVKTASGEISYWNQGAERLYGWKASEAMGHSPAELLHSHYPVPLAEIESRQTWEGEIRHTKRDGSRIVVASRWTRFEDENGHLAGWLEINTDITARKQAENAARSLSGRLLTLQDDERRRIARDLHDSLGQYLTALKMRLDSVSGDHEVSVASLVECSKIADKCLAETRTLSYLLHPPLLDEAGLASAAHWYVDGFAKRSGIKATLRISDNLPRMRRDVETALFRTLQEGLTNVHRHSHSSRVDIALSADEEQVRLEISDDGGGIPPKRLKLLLEDAAEAGVGIPGMRERMRELGGTLRIDSDRSGTLLRVAIPISQAIPDEAPGGGSGHPIIAA